MIRNVVMCLPGLYEILGQVRIVTFGPYIWLTEDLEGPGASGAIFRCYEEGNDQELAYLLAADVSGDPTEPDIEKLRPTMWKRWTGFWRMGSVGACRMKGAK